MLLRLPRFGILYRNELGRESVQLAVCFFDLPVYKWIRATSVLIWALVSRLRIADHLAAPSHGNSETKGH